LIKKLTTEIALPKYSRHARNWWLLFWNGYSDPIPGIAGFCPFASHASDQNDSTARHGGRLPHCGKSIRPMSARGHSRHFEREVGMTASPP